MIALAASLTFLIGCEALTGKEVGRMPINHVSTNDDNLIIQELSLDLEEGEDISIWSDMDIAYEGEVSLRFRIDVLKVGETIANLTLDPTDKNITIGEVKKSIMGKTDWRFSGKNSVFEIEESGRYTFKGILIASDNQSLEVNKAEVVLKK